MYIIIYAWIILLYPCWAFVRLGFYPPLQNRWAFVRWAFVRLGFCPQDLCPYPHRKKCSVFLSISFFSEWHRLNKITNIYHVLNAMDRVQITSPRYDHGHRISTTISFFEANFQTLACLKNLEPNCLSGVTETIQFHRKSNYFSLYVSTRRIPFKSLMQVATLRTWGSTSTWSAYQRKVLPRRL